MRLLPKGPKLYRGSKSFQLLAEPLSHTNDIRATGILS
jgi:hypothetical protein